MNPATVAPASSSPVLLRRLAVIFSWLLHPLFIPAVVAWWMLYQHPVNRLLTDDPIRLRIIAMIIINTVLFPGLFVLLLWRLRFIGDIHMHTRRERIIPLTVSLLFYFWAYYVGRNLEAMPPALQQWLMGVFLASCAAMFTNIFFKLSLHTLGAGGAVMFLAIQAFTDSRLPANWLLPALLLAGLSGTARLLGGAHSSREVYAGYLAGAICQVAAYYMA